MTLKAVPPDPATVGADLFKHIDAKLLLFWERRNSSSKELVIGVTLQALGAMIIIVIDKSGMLKREKQKMLGMLWNDIKSSGIVKGWK